MLAFVACGGGAGSPSQTKAAAPVGSSAPASTGARLVALSLEGPSSIRPGDEITYRLHFDGADGLVVAIDWSANPDVTYLRARLTGGSGTPVGSPGQGGRIEWQVAGSGALEVDVGVPAGEPPGPFVVTCAAPGLTSVACSAVTTTIE